MPERNPLTALRKAESIGADPLAAEWSTAAMPTDPAMLRSLGKPISDLLSAVFKTPKAGQTGLPSRVRLTNRDARKGTVDMHGVRKSADRLEATPGQLDDLLNSGAIELEQPPQGAVDMIQRKLAELLGAARANTPPVGTPRFQKQFEAAVTDPRNMRNGFVPPK
jgi:hypothetical protein